MKLRYTIMFAGACLLFAGCAHKPIVIWPAMAIKTPETEMVDKRGAHAVAPKANRPVDPKAILGVWPGGLAIVLPGDRPAVEMVAGIVAMHADPAKVELTRFEMNPDYGFWAHRTHVDIAAKVTLRSGGEYELSGRGENLMVNLTAENFGLAVERALRSFEESVKRVSESKGPPTGTL